VELTTTNNVKSPKECPFDQGLALVQTCKRGDAAASMIRAVEFTAFVLVLVVICVAQDRIDDSFARWEFSTQTAFFGNKDRAFRVLSVEQIKKPARLFWSRPI